MSLSDESTQASNGKRKRETDNAEFVPLPHLTLPRAWARNASVFEGHDTIESVDILKVRSLIYHGFGITYLNSDRYKDGAGRLYDNEEQQMIKYLRNYDEARGAFISKVHAAEGGWGRVQPEGFLSQSVFVRKTRHALVKDVYIDFDESNCQPNALSQLCAMARADGNVPPDIRTRLNCPMLQHYVENHKHMRSEIMTHYGVTKDVAKRIFICFMFGGSLRTWIVENQLAMKPPLQYLLDLEAELKLIIPVIADANPDIKASLLKVGKKDYRDPWKLQVATVSKVLCTIERMTRDKAAQEVVHLTGCPIENIIECQDGMLIPKQFVERGCSTDDEKKQAHQGLCERMRAKVREVLCYDIPWETKEFDEAIDIPEYDENEWNAFVAANPSKFEVNDWGQILQPRGIAKKTLEFYNTDGQFRITLVKESEDLAVYKDPMWYRDEKDIDGIIGIIIADFVQPRLRQRIENDRSLNGKGDEVVRMKRRIIDRLNTLCGCLGPHLTHIRKAMRSILLDMGQRCSPASFDSKPFLLGFRNGVVDLRTKRFRPYQFDDYITLHTGYEYHPPSGDTASLERRRQVEEFFSSIMPNDGERKFMRQQQCACLDGILYSNVSFLNGAGRNGKTIIVKLTAKILGSKLSHSVPNSVFHDMVKNASSGTCGENVSDLRGKRMLYFDEPSNVDLGVLKLLTGGAEITARRLYCNNETFRLSAMTFMLFNEVPDMGNLNQSCVDAIRERVWDVYFSSIFTSNEARVGQVEERKGYSVVYKPANNMFGLDSWQESVRYELLDILLDSYVEFVEAAGGPEQFTMIKFEPPPRVTENSATLVGDLNPFAVIRSMLYKTNSMFDIVYTSDIYDKVKGSPTFKNMCARKLARDYNCKNMVEWLREYGFDPRKNKHGKVFLSGYSYSEGENEGEIQGLCVGDDFNADGASDVAQPGVWEGSSL